MQNILLKVPATAIAYYIAAWVGINITVLEGGIPVFWPGNAVLFCALITSPGRYWPLLWGATLIAELAANTTHYSLLASLSFGVANTLEASLIALGCNTLLARQNKKIDFRRVDHTLVFITLALFVVPPACALLGALIKTHIAAIDQSFWSLWRTWWLADATGHLLVTPLFFSLLHLFKFQTKNSSQRIRLGESLVIFSLLIVFWFTLIQLGQKSEEWTLVTPLLVMVPILWASLRMKTAFYTLITSSVCLLTISVSQTGYGPFANENPLVTAISLQQFICLLCCIALMIGAFTQQLHRQNNKLRVYKLAVDSSREGIVVTKADEDQPIIYCNAAFEQLTGYSLEEVKGKNCRFLNRTHSNQHALESLREAIQQKKYAEVLLLNETKSGTTFWNSLRIAPVGDGSGKPQHFIGLQSDVTQQINNREQLEHMVHETTEKLMLANERISMATEVFGLGIWEWRIASGELIWDNNMLKMYEPPEERFDSIAYDLWRDRLHPDDGEAVEKSLQDFVAKGESWDEEFRLLMRDGRIKYIKASARVIRDTTGQALRVTGANLDITDIREMEQELRNAAEKAQLSDRLKSEFLANMSHEIRTPMNGVLGMAELLSKTHLNPLQSEYVSTIVSSGTNLLNLLNDILDLSKIEANELELTEETFNLEDLVLSSLKSYSSNAFEKGLELDVYINPDLPRWIKLDSVRLSQILSNLVGNAIKFTPHGSVTVNVTSLERTTSAGRIWLRIVVADTGIGMPQEKLDKIFDPFQQVDGTITRRFGGTGLGLAIVKKLVTIMHGQISVDSVIDQGSTFTLDIPIALAEPPKSRPEFPLLSEQLIRDALQQSLVVDDSEVNRRWLKDMIAAWGGQADTAPDAATALRMLSQADQQQRPYRLLLVDKNMPNQSGFELVSQIRNSNMLQPDAVVMLSSSQINSDLAAAKQAGIDHYLLKPIQQSDVYNTLVEILDKKAAKDSQAGQPLKISHPKTSRPLCILLAEDNEVNQRLVSYSLGGRGHELDVVDNGEQAIKAYQTKVYDLILMDVQMPVMDGLEATRRIREYEAHMGCQHTPIIGLTAHAMKGDAEICIDAGMDQHLTKPISSDDLIQAIEAYPPKDRAYLPLDASAPSSAAPAKISDNNNEKNFQYFDMQQAMSTCGNSMDLLKQVAEKAIEVCPEIRLAIGQHVAEDNGAQASAAAHKLKGAIANFCVDTLVIQMKQFEQEAETMSVTDRAARWKKIEGPLQELENELKRLISEERS
ncbi:MAG: response regulator [Oleiphilaceae bacterium]|nr:response regulator [Oleiphilaceae bacterium]